MVRIVCIKRAVICAADRMEGVVNSFRFTAMKRFSFTPLLLFVFILLPVLASI